MGWPLAVMVGVLTRTARRQDEPWRSQFGGIKRSGYKRIELRARICLCDDAFPGGVPGLLLKEACKIHDLPRPFLGYLALVPFLPVFPASWTLWLLTVGGLQTYQAIPGEIMPDYIDRQVVFHSIVLAAIARDAWAFGLLRAIPALTKTTGDLPT